MAALNKVVLKGSDPRGDNNMTCMNVDKARGVYKDRYRRRSVISAYTHGKKT